MDKTKSEIVRAKIIYFFKETFRAHSKAEYKEIFSRGLNEDNGGITGAYPFLYVRAFFALFILFTINILVLRLTDNALYAPSVNFIGGITFTVPFFILLYELYPKRDISIFLLLALLVGGGTVAGVLAQVCYEFIPVDNKWLSAIEAGVVEEICKIIPAIIVICFLKQKNPYACFLIAAAVGAGFSVIEDMGYIFYYSDRFVFNYHSDIQATIYLFFDRGASSLCTHVLWTGAAGWAYCVSKKPYRSFNLLVLALSIILHSCWDLPLEGWWQVIDIVLCTIVAAAVNIAIVHLSRVKTLAAEVDLKRVNAEIIREAKEIGERLRFTNAANLTFALTCTILSAIILALCALPIGMEYQHESFDSKEDFIAYIEGGYNLTADWDRSYDPDGYNIEERYIEGVLSYVIQRHTASEADYYYGYFIDENGAEIDSLWVEVDDIPDRINCSEYTFDDQIIWAFDINADSLISYSYYKDGSIDAVTDAEEFTGYDLLIALIATGVGVAGGCNVILCAFTLKLRRRLKDER